jgi:proliferating cell nuclear antigen
MRLTIENKIKQEIFVSLFQLLKNWSSHINMHFENDRLYIQSMDKSHICLADIVFKNIWFCNYECFKEVKISLDSNQFAILINYALKHDIIEIKFDDNNIIDNLYINFLNAKEKKTTFDHFFELPLIDVEEENLGIPNVEYEVDFTIESKKFVEVLSELHTFGQDLHVICNEKLVELNANVLKVHIPIDDLISYAIAEDDELNISFSLNHLCKLCTSTKLSQMIDISLGSQFPMALIYNIGDESKIAFYIAPKVSES